MINLQLSSFLKVCLICGVDQNIFNILFISIEIIIKIIIRY